MTIKNKTLVECWENLLNIIFLDLVLLYKDYVPFMGFSNYVDRDIGMSWTNLH